MKRIFSVIITLLLVTSSFAEDVIQIIPRVVKPGLTEDDGECLEVEMRNTTYNEIANLQFDLLLPEGMTFDYEDFDSERVASKKKGKNVTYAFSIQTAEQASGYTRFAFIPNEIDGDLKPITGNSGVFMQLYISTASDMKPGIYPIYMDNIKFVKSETEGFYVYNTVSYVVVSENGETNLLNSMTDIDLSGMTGYVPSFVVEQLNTDIASNTNLRSLNLSGTTFANLGAELSVPNNDNLLWYTSDKATLNRTFKADQWNTVCLPFTLQTSYLNASTVVKEMADYDGEATITLGDVTTMEAGKPYLIYTPTTGELIKDVTISNPVPVSTEPSTTTSNGLTMRGTYQESTVKSDGGYTRYGFAGGKFVMLGTGSATVPPFRAYLELLGKSSTRSINIAGDGTTGINSTISDDESNGPLYDLRGVMMNEGQQNKGIYVRNGKKLVLK